MTIDRPIFERVLEQVRALRAYRHEYDAASALHEIILQARRDQRREDAAVCAMRGATTQNLDVHAALAAVAVEINPDTTPTLEEV